MSLTRHLDDPESPVRLHFEREYSNLERLRFAEDPNRSRTPSPVVTVNGYAHAFTTGLRFSPGLPQVLPPGSGAGERRYDWGCAGAALDYRIRFLLDAQDPDRLVAALGARSLGRPLGGSDEAGGQGWAGVRAALLDLTDDGAGIPGPIPQDQTTEPLVSGLCGLLALYDQLHRVPRARLGTHPLVMAGPDAPLAELLALVDDRLPGDVAAMTELFARTQVQLFRARDVVSNPTFDRSHDLGGADADFIADGTLVELKAVKKPALDKRTVWQLLGYLLADTSDRHRIREVCWYFPRHGYAWRFPANEFLSRLHGRPLELADARAQFAELFAPAPKSTSEATWDSWLQPPTIEREVSFFPAVSGRGRWHVSTAQVSGLQDWAPATSPVCGARAVLNLEVQPVVPTAGQSWSADNRLCGHCLNFTKVGWALLERDDGGLST